MRLHPRAVFDGRPQTGSSDDTQKTPAVRAAYMTFWLSSFLVLSEPYSSFMSLALATNDWIGVNNCQIGLSHRLFFMYQSCKLKDLNIETSIK